MIQKFSILKEGWFQFMGIFLLIYLQNYVFLLLFMVQVHLLLVLSFIFQTILTESYLEVIKVFWEVFLISLLVHILMVQASLFTLCQVVRLLISYYPYFVVFCWLFE
jgi:hypothetical protein